MNNEVYLAHLIHCALTNKTPIPLPKEVDLEKVYKKLAFNSLSNLVYPALQRLNPPKEDVVLQRFRADYQKVFNRQIIFTHAREELLIQFEEKGIDYLPLKGIVLQDYYPMSGMRFFSDNDLLIKDSQSEEILTIMDNLGYDFLQRFLDLDKELACHYCFYQKPILNFELHWRLFNKDSTYSTYSNDIWNSLERDNDHQHGYHMSKEDCYLYILMHYDKHNKSSGMGLRFLVDVYVFLEAEKERLNWDYLKRELKIYGLEELEEEKRNLAYALFDEEFCHLDEIQEKKYLYMLTLGTYGSLEKGMNTRMKRMMKAEGGISLQQAKRKYIRDLIFPNRKILFIRYSILEKYPYLFPVFYFVRIVQFLLSKKRKKRIGREMKILRKMRKINED